MVSAGRKTVEMDSGRVIALALAHLVAAVHEVKFLI
jgi:hypothetical protein